MSFTNQLIKRFLIGSAGLMFGIFLLWHDKDPVQAYAGMWFCVVSFLYLALSIKRYVKF